MYCSWCVVKGDGSVGCVLMVIWLVVVNAGMFILVCVVSDGIDI